VSNKLKTTKTNLTQKDGICEALHIEGRPTSRQSFWAVFGLRINCYEYLPYFYFRSIWPVYLTTCHSLRSTVGWFLVLPMLNSVGTLSVL